MNGIADASPNAARARALRSGTDDGNRVRSAPRHASKGRDRSSTAPLQHGAGGLP